MSFRTRSELLALVRNNLTSNLWNSIKDSLIGSELIAYAAEFLYLQEVQSDEIVSSVYPSENSSLLNVLLNGNFNNVAFSYFRPATITVTLANSEGKILDTRGNDVTSSFPTYLEPYTLRLTKGNVVYTNINWVGRDGKITLYQGNPRVLSLNGDATSNGRFYQQVTQASQNDSDIYRTFGSADFYSYYVKLESLPYVDSVYVYSHKNSMGWRWNTYQLYDSINAGWDAMNYKLFWGTDVKLQLHFGDGLWGKGFQTDEVYYIYYLDCTFNSIDLSGLTLAYTDRNLTDSIQGIAYNVIGTQDYSVSMAVSFQNLRNALSKNSVVSTKKQVESFVSAYPLVKDCSVVPSETVGNMVNIYVRPNVASTGSYDAEDAFDMSYLTDITEALQTYGDLVTRYVMNKARKLELSIAVTLLDEVEDFENLSQEIKNYIANLVYNSTIGQSVNFSELSNDIYKNFGVRNIVRYYVAREEVSDNKLSFLPVLKTIKSLDITYPSIGSGEEQHSWHGTIENGVLWAKNDSFEEASVGEGVQYVHPMYLSYQFGDFSLVTFEDTQDRNVYVFSGNECKFVSKMDKFLFDNNYSIDSDPQGKFNFSFENPTESAISICAFNIQKNPTTYSIGNYGYYSNESDTNFYKPNPGAVDSFCDSYYDLSTAYFLYFIPSFASYKGTFFVTVGSLNNTVTLRRVNTNQHSDFSVPLPAFSQSQFRGYYVTDDNLYVLTNTANVVYMLAHTSTSLSLPRLILLDENSIPMGMNMTVGLFQGWTFGLNYGAFLTSKSNGSFVQLQNDGRLGVNVFKIPNETTTASMTVYSENGYAVFCFTKNTCSDSVKFMLYNSTTHEEIQLSIITSYGDASILPVYALLNTNEVNLSSYNELRMYIGTATTPTATYALTANNTTNVTHYINICEKPDTSNSNVVKIQKTRTFRFTGGASIGTGYSEHQYFDTLSCMSFHNLHFGSKIGDDYYLTADTILFYKDTTATNPDATTHLYDVGRLMIHCYNDGTEDVAEFVPNYSKLEKVGYFSQDGTLNKIGDSDIERLNVSYEAQNSYFEVDEKSYVVLDSDDIYVQKI